MKKGQKVPITERALAQRINRALREHRQQVRKWRGRRVQLGQHWLDRGDWYLMDWGINAVLDVVDLDDLGRELGVLNPWETVGDI